MRNEKFFPPSLTKVLEEYKFPLANDSMEDVKKIDDLIFEIFQELFDEERILNVRKCSPINDKDEKFLFLFKIFFDENKYFKLFFQFSSKKQFLGIFFNSYAIIMPTGVSKKCLKEIFYIELENIKLGLSGEKHFGKKFLPLFKANNAICTGFEDLTGNPAYDKEGIDFRVMLKHGAIYIQIKTVRKGSGIAEQKRTAEKHFNHHSTTALFFVSVEEKYSETKKRFLGLVKKAWSGEYPFVSYYTEG